eukprot:21550-Heterococcus_DN1.PRE.2
MFYKLITQCSTVCLVPLQVLTAYFCQHITFSSVDFSITQAVHSDTRTDTLLARSYGHKCMCAKLLLQQQAQHSTAQLADAVCLIDIKLLIALYPDRTFAKKLNPNGLCISLDALKNGGSSPNANLHTGTFIHAYRHHNSNSSRLASNIKTVTDTWHLAALHVSVHCVVHCMGEALQTMTIRENMLSCLYCAAVLKANSCLTSSDTLVEVASCSSAVAEDHMLTEVSPLTYSTTTIETFYRKASLHCKETHCYIT